MLRRRFGQNTACSSRPNRSTQAFTLIEMAVVIAIILVLATLGLSGISKVRSNADSTRCLSNLRQVGLAITAYAAENDNYLPGPFRVGQNPYYRSGDKDTLGHRLASYLNLPEPTSTDQYAKILECPAWLKQAVDLNQRPPSYHMLDAAVVNGREMFPFGYPGSSEPIKLVQVAQSGLSNTPAMMDIDQRSPRLTPGTSWIRHLPPKPVHGNYRNALFFDLHAERVPAE